MRRFGMLLMALAMTLFLGLSGMSCAKKLDQKLCDKLVKKFSECKMVLLKLSTQKTCKEKVGKRISDYDKMEKWSNMNCKDLGNAVKEELKKKKKK